MLSAKQSLRTESAAKEKNSSSFFSPHFVQAKLQVNEPGDSYEQEADAMADHVMRMADPAQGQQAFFKPAATGIQRKCQHCDEEDKMLQRKENSPAETRGNSQLDSYIGSLGSSGQALPDTSKSFFESRFGQDFSNVRIHTDTVAAESARSINALAYTTGNNIVFNQGQYSPESDSGKKLMAHELTHVVQQGKNLVAREVIQRTPGVDAQDSMKDFINFSMDQGTVDAQAKTIRATEAVKRMLDTGRGAGLVNALWKVACGKTPPCKKINVIFMDDVTTICPEAAGCFDPTSANSFPYTVKIGNVSPAPPSRSRKLSSQWGQGDNKVVWHHTEPESAMANTLFHELLHVFFVNNKNHDPAMPTGHNDAEKGEIDPNYSRFLQEYNTQLDTNEQNNRSGSKP